MDNFIQQLSEYHKFSLFLHLLQLLQHIFNSYYIFGLVGSTGGIRHQIACSQNTVANGKNIE